MAKLHRPRALLARTRERALLGPKDRAVLNRLLDPGNGRGVVSIDARELPQAVLTALLDDDQLTANQRAAVALELYGMSRTKIDRERLMALIQGAVGGDRTATAGSRLICGLAARGWWVFAFQTHGWPPLAFRGITRPGPWIRGSPSRGSRRPVKGMGEKNTPPCILGQ